MNDNMTMDQLPQVGGASVNIGRTDGKLSQRIEFTVGAPCGTTAVDILTLEPGYVVTGCFVEVTKAGTGTITVAPDAASSGTAVALTTLGTKAMKLWETVAVSKVTIKGAASVTTGAVKIVLLVSDVS